MFHLHTRLIEKRLSLPAIKLALVALLAYGAGNAYAQGDELLPSDEAYAFDVSVTEAGLDARWTIADDYYMYRDKLSFSLADSAGKPIELDYEYPKSKKKSDPIFGDVEVYFHQANFMIPAGAASGDVVLTVKGQGCNEPVGVCYPPIKHEIPLSLISSAAAQTAVVPLMNATPGEAGELNSIDELRDLLGGADGADEELLPADEAFKVSAITDRDNLVVRFDVADGYYLYQSKLKFNSNTHSLTQAVLPEGELKQDEYFGEQVVYKHQFDALLKPVGAGSGETLVLKTEYQGCADLGVCYPPQKKTFELSVAGLISSASAQQGELEDPDPEAASTASASAAVAATNEKKVGKSDALWWILLTAFVAGVGLTFTPCVLPLIPILSSVIGGQGPDITKAKAAWLASIYVLGTAVTYAAIGAVAGATGDQLQAYFQNAWAIGIMSGIFVVMALSMFGIFEIQMPSFLQSKLASSSQGIKGGSTVMVFILGLISALIVGACVSPVLISFLSLAIAKGSPVLGALTMFSMAMGMGIPLILIGMGAGHLIPKAGVWMDKVKYVFGVMLIAVAVYLLSVLPGVPVLYFWSALFIVVAVYMGATQSLPEAASGWAKLFKGIGTLLLIWGVLALVGAIYGQRDILKPLPEQLFTAAPQFVAPGDSSIELREHPFERVNSVEELDQRMADAVKSGKNVMIDYYADWCVECVKMEKSTFKNRAVREELATRYVALQVDVTDPKDEKRKLLKKRYGVFGPPAALFFDSNGVLMEDKNFYGFMNADKFLTLLRSI